MAERLGIVNEIKPQASIVLRRDPKSRVLDERGELVGKPISALQFSPVSNILSRSVADVAARDDVRTGRGISGQPTPTAQAPVSTAMDVFGPSAITPQLFTPPATGVTPAPPTEVAPVTPGIATPVEEIPAVAPVLGDIDFSSIEGLVKGVGSVAEFTQNLQKFNRARGISPGGRGGRQAIKTSDIQGRIKFLQERLTKDFTITEEQQTEVTDELDILNQFIQSRLGVRGARDKSRAEDEKRIRGLISSIRADK
jgi:hypothetical protein